MEFWKKIGFQISLFLLKKIHNFLELFHKISTHYNKTPQKYSISNISILKKFIISQNSFIKSLIHTIKCHKNFQYFLTNINR